MKYLQRVREILQALRLPMTLEGCSEAHKRMRVAEALKIRIPAGEFEGCYDNERIEKEMLPKILKKNPEILPLLKKLNDRDEGFVDLCGHLDWFLEKVHMLAGNRPLPFHLGVHVKNFAGEEPRFGFLIWEDGNYRIKIKEPSRLEEWPAGRTCEELNYPTAFDAAMEGWLVD